MAREREYNADERRVVDYLVNELFHGQVGAGDDPIGFLIASHRALVRRSSRLGRAEVLLAQLTDEVSKFLEQDDAS